MPKSSKGLHCTMIDGVPHVNLFHSQEMFDIGPNYNKWVQSEWDADLSTLVTFGLQAHDVFPGDDPKCYMYYSLEGFLMLFFKKVCIQSLDAQRKMDYIKFLRHVCHVYAQQVTKILSQSDGTKTAQVDLLETATTDLDEGHVHTPPQNISQIREPSSPARLTVNPSMKERSLAPTAKRSKLIQKVDELRERRSRESSPNVTEQGMNGVKTRTSQQGAAPEQRNGTHDKSSPVNFHSNPQSWPSTPVMNLSPQPAPEPIRIKMEPPDNEEDNHNKTGGALETSPYSIQSWMPKIGQTSSLAQGQGLGQGQTLFSPEEGAISQEATAEQSVAMHLRRKGYSCLTCKQTFANGKKHWMHKLETGHGQIFCEMCHARFLMEEELADHVCEVHDEIQRLFCQKCNKEFPNIQSKKAHQRYCGRSYRCNDCKQRFPDPDQLLSHRIVCTGPKSNSESDPAKLPTDKTGTRKAAAAAKRKLAEADLEEARPLLNCVYCGSWLDNGEYARHVQKCKKQFRGRDKGFKCSDCELRFKTAEELVSHRVIHANTSAQSQESNKSAEK